MTDLDRLSKLADETKKALEDATTPNGVRRFMLLRFRESLSPDTIIGLIARVKEAETALETSRGEVYEEFERVQSADGALASVREALRRTESRLRAAEEVEKAARDYTNARKPFSALRDALRRYDEAVERVKE